MGPNGSGKSTLARTSWRGAICYDVTDGEILFEGQESDRAGT